MNRKEVKKPPDSTKRNRVHNPLKKDLVKIDAIKRNKLEVSVREYAEQVWSNEEINVVEKHISNLTSDIIGRLESTRITYIPFLNKTIPLNGCNILEVGCGTGSSLVALAEQGANVTGIEIDEPSIRVAKDLCQIYNVKATFIPGNACDVFHEIRNQKFDLVLFFASIEHMLYNERIDCLKKYYSILPDDAYLSIIETPNRLWHFDDHTSFLPFFHWLPDNLAFDYFKFSNININTESLHENSDEEYLQLLRRGRGFSFHELDIALNFPAEKLEIVDYMKPFMLTKLDNTFHRVLTKLNPKISKGFFYPNIDIIIKK